MSPKLRNMSLFAQKMLFFLKFQFLAKSSFLKKNLSHSKNQPHTLAQQVPNNMLLQAPAQRRYRKKTKILKEGARGDRGSPDQNESPIPDLSNAL